METKNKLTAKSGFSLPSCSPPSTPETDNAAYEATTRTVGKWIVPLTKARKIEIERNAMREWILLAAPMLSTACCIVIEEAVGRLSEIEGCRGLLELCPVDFINPETKP